MIDMQEVNEILTFQIVEHGYWYYEDVEENNSNPWHSRNKMANHQKPDNWQEQWQNSPTNNQYWPWLPNISNISLQMKQKKWKLSFKNFGMATQALK